jgi:hypothetical protein
MSDTCDKYINELANKTVDYETNYITRRVSFHDQEISDQLFTIGYIETFSQQGLEPEIRQPAILISDTNDTKQTEQIKNTNATPDTLPIDIKSDEPISSVSEIKGNKNFHFVFLFNLLLNSML